MSTENNLFEASYYKSKIVIEEQFLEEGGERNLLKKLKKFKLGSGHERMEICKIDNDEYVFILIPYYGAPDQRIYFNRIK